MIFASPTATMGYYRGSPMAGGQGSGIGGVGVASSGVQSLINQGPTTGPGKGGFHPTVLYMFALILLEMFVFAFISRHL